MNINMPSEIYTLLKKLTDAGTETVLVGGCIRDALCGRTPKDYDMATSAEYSELKSILEPEYRLVQVGKSFATTLVIGENLSVEISKFRREHDGQVLFDGTLESDLLCRDFTLNSLAYNFEKGLIDPLNGAEDLKKGILRSADARARFQEDPIRMLRAIRMKSEYMLEYDKDLWENLMQFGKRAAEIFSTISSERKRDILFKMLSTKKPSETIRDMIETGLISAYDFGSDFSKMVSYDQQNPFHDKTLFDHTMVVLDSTKNQIETRLAALFHDIGKLKTQSFDEKGIAHYYQHESVSGEEARCILEDLNCSNYMVDTVETLIRAHMFNPEDLGQKGLRKLIRKVDGFKNMYFLLDLMKADILGTAHPDRVVAVEALVEQVGMLESKDTVFKRKDLDITGHDLVQLGIPQGEKIGQVLNVLLDQVVEGNLKNEKAVLVQFIRDNQ